MKCDAGVYFITHACWIILIYHILRYSSIYPQHAGFSYKFWLYMSWFEVPFSIWLQYLSYKANEFPKFKPRDPEEMRYFLMQCLDVGLARNQPAKKGELRRPKIRNRNFSNLDTVTDEQAAFTRKKIRQWFFNKPVKEIKADNGREWLAWAVGGGRSLEEAREEPATMAVVDEGLAWVQQRCRFRLEAGYNPDAPCIRLTRDKLNVLSRPLGYYVVTNGVTFLCYAWLVAKGFKLVSSHGIQFLVKPPVPLDQRKPRDPNDKYARDFKLPIVFLHGLGIGLGQYLTFVRYLASSEKGVILMLQPNISTQIWHPKFLHPASVQDHVDAVKDVTKRFGVSKATILSHSNGTMVHGCESLFCLTHGRPTDEIVNAGLLRGCPELCARNVLVDPVSFRLWEAGRSHIS